MAKTAPIGAHPGGSSGLPSYAGMVSRSMPFASRPSSSGFWRELNTVTFKPLDCHLPVGRRYGKELRSFILESLGDLVLEIDCLQILRDKTVKIVFSEPEASQRFFDEGFSLNGVNVELKPPYKPDTRVIVQDLPFHMPASVVRTAFSSFGEVKSIFFRKETDSLKSGDRIVSLVLKQAIPRHIVVGGYPGRVFYSGQPPFCEICRGDHLDRKSVV